MQYDAPLVARQGEDQTEKPQKSLPGAVTLIQRFGSALNLNIHFDMLFLDGVYIDCFGNRDSCRLFRGSCERCGLSGKAHTEDRDKNQFIDKDSGKEQGDAPKRSK